MLTRTTRTHWLWLLGLCLLIACQPAQEEKSPAEPSRTYAQTPERPNILWLVTEDLGPYIPSFGDSTVATPHLSRLAAEGIRFTKVFSPSGVCAPSRAALATGMYPSGIGANHMRTGGNAQFLPEGVVPYEAVPPPMVKMHSEYLREIGYYCTNNAKEDYQFRKSLMAWDESSNQAHWRNRAPGKPFFAIFNFGVTHESRIWAKAEDSLWIAEDHPVPVPPYLPDNEVGRRDVRRMYSNIKEMDAQVGEVLKQLEEDGLLESTIIFWYGDHGGPLPRMKRLAYDSGLRVPMIVRLPEKQWAGRVDTQLVSFIDFLPTLLSLTGQEPPAYLDGQAFMGPYQAASPRKYIHAASDRFDERYDMIRAVRDHRYKYMKNFRPNQGYYLPVAYREQMPVMQELLRMRDAGELNEYQAQWFRESKPEEELFDCKADPHELHNLAEDPAYAEKLEELRTEGQRWMEAIDDKGMMPESTLIETIWPGKVQPITEAPTYTAEKQGIHLSSATEGASLGYQLLAPGEEPSSKWEVYTGPVQVPEGRTLVAVAHRLGYQPSEVVVVEPGT